MSDSTLLLPASIDPKARDSINERIRENKAAVIEEIRKWANIPIAAKLGNVSTKTVYRWLKEDAEFKKEFKAAEKEGITSLRGKAEASLIKNGTDVKNWRAAEGLLKYLDRKENQGNNKVSSEFQAIFTNPDALNVLVELANIMKQKEKLEEEK